MRYFFLLFSCYLSLLAVLPCSDSVECKENRAEQVTDHRNHGSDHEQCPPFCSCACCGVQIAPVAPAIVFQASLSPKVSKARPSFYRSSFPVPISFSIWQPPKIS